MHVCAWVCMCKLVHDDAVYIWEVPTQHSESAHELSHILRSGVRFSTFAFHVSHERNRGWLGYIGDYIRYPVI